MSKDEPPKSAFELAMERLRAQDRAQGVDPGRPLTARQKAEIAELRAGAKAKLAELEILYRRDRAAAAGDPDKLRELEERYLIDRSRVESRVESAVRKVKEGKAG